MDSTTILEKFVDARSKYEDIILPSQFRKWFPKHVSGTGLQILAQYLQEDRNLLVQEVKQNIKKEFNVPVEDIVIKEQEAEFSGFEKLVENLFELDKFSKTQEEVLDDEIEQCTSDIQTLNDVIERLSEKSSKLNAISQESTTESLEKLGQLMNVSRKHH